MLNHLRQFYWVVFVAAFPFLSTNAYSIEPINYKDVSGQIQALSGSSDELQNWTVVLMDRQTQISYTSLIDTEGNYVFKDVDLGKIYAIFLLNQDRVLVSGLTIASTAQSFLHQYFRIQNPQLPDLVLRGMVLNFLNLEGIKTEVSFFTTDADANLILDELVMPSLPDPSPERKEFSNRKGAIDQDQDGIPNTEDSDIDGLGLPNVLDSDDDNDSILDVFDSLDRNGDLVEDSLVDTDLAFAEGLDWIDVLIERETSFDGKDTFRLSFTAKVNDALDPAEFMSLKINGPDSLLAKATLEDKSVWDRFLAKGELTEDRLLSATVILDNDAVIKQGQVLFFELATEKDGILENRAFAYKIPKGLSLRPLTVQFIAVSLQLQMIQDPFGVGSLSLNNNPLYNWVIAIYDEEGNLVINSFEQSSQASILELDNSVIDTLQEGVKYYYQVQVYTESPTGKLSYNIRSAPTAFSVTFPKP